MPSQIDAPPSLTGPPTSSAPANTIIGAGYTSATNLLTSQATGGETFGLAAALTLFFEWFKKRSWFDQQEHAVIALLIFSLLLSIGYAEVAIWLAHKDTGQAILEAIPRAGTTAWQAQQNYVAGRATGLGIFNPAPTMPAKG